MDPITKLLGGVVRVRLLRLFLFNPETMFDRDTAARRVRTRTSVASRELSSLVKVGVLKKKQRTTAGKRAGSKRKITVYQADASFEYFASLRAFLLDTLSISHDELLSELRSHARLKMVVLSGFFLGAWERRLDLLLIADRVDEEGLAKAVGQLEAHLGRELSYAFLSPEDYRYRASIQDRLLRDVFDYDHEVILDRMGL